MNRWVSALVVSGSNLYVGGDFFNAAGIPQADYVIAYLVLPSLQAITRIKPNPINKFQVTFDEPVAGVDAADFALTATGTLAARALTNGSGATYTVIVAVGASTLRRDTPACATIADLAGVECEQPPLHDRREPLYPGADLRAAGAAVNTGRNGEFMGRKRAAPGPMVIHHPSMSHTTYRVCRQHRSGVRKLRRNVPTRSPFALTTYVTPNGQDRRAHAQPTSRSG